MQNLGVTIFDSQSIRINWDANVQGRTLPTAGAQATFFHFLPTSLLLFSPSPSLPSLLLLLPSFFPLSFFLPCLCSSFPPPLLLPPSLSSFLNNITSLLPHSAFAESLPFLDLRKWNWNGVQDEKGFAGRLLLSAWWISSAGLDLLRVQLWVLPGTSSNLEAEMHTASPWKPKCQVRLGLQVRLQPTSVSSYKETAITTTKRWPLWLGKEAKKHFWWRKNLSYCTSHTQKKKQFFSFPILMGKFPQDGCGVARQCPPGPAFVAHALF